MAKLRPSLEAFAQAAATGNVEQFPTPVAKPEVGPAPAPRARQDRPHVSIYLDKRVQKAIKEIALQYDRKAHDLYLEGINLMLAQYGRPPIDEMLKS